MFENTLICMCICANVSNDMLHELVDTNISCILGYADSLSTDLLICESKFPRAWLSGIYKRGKLCATFA